MTDDTDTVDALQTLIDDADLDEDEDWAIFVRELELHELVALHEDIDRIRRAIEGEFGYRVENDDKLAAGNDEERNYADEHADPAY